jgi:ribosome-associated protein
MDFCGVIVHVFTEEQRKFYDLERLWGDAPIVDLDPILNPQA